MRLTKADEILNQVQNDDRTLQRYGVADELRVPTIRRSTYSNFLMTRQAFWPPNPKLFERVMFTSVSRATFGM